MADSSDDSDNFNETIEIPYSKRPEWADIQPILQDNETNDIVRIAYTETFKEVYDYFRAILKLNEKSDRAFELTKDAALLNPANYTVWYYRRILLKDLNKDLNEELEFITNVIRSHPKNYQVWEHRKNVVDRLQDPSQELFFTQQIIKKDSKNYHAWQYRQWVIRTFALWRNEIEYVEELLDEDVRNNSAWNQRYFVISNTNDLSKPESVKILNEEIDFCLKKIENCVDNESSWNYLRAMITHLMNNSPEGTSEYPAKVVEFCLKKFNSDKDEERSPFLLFFITECHSNRIKNVLAKYADKNQANSEVGKIVKDSIEILESLGSKYDTIRVNYWNYVVSKWKTEYNAYL